MIGNVVLDPSVEETPVEPKRDTWGRPISQDRLATRLWKEPPPAPPHERTGRPGHPYLECTLTDEQILFALKKCHGLVNKACEMLGIKSYQSLYSRLNHNEELKEALHDIRELRLDKTENKLFKKIDKDEDMDAIKFHLSTKGKVRGYIQSVTQGLPQEMPLTINIIPIGTVNVNMGEKGEEPKEVSYEEVSDEKKVEESEK